MKHNNIFRNTLMGLSILAAVCVVFTLSACSDDDDDDNDDTTSSDTTSSDTTYVNGYAAVDLGLSVKWATMNVGAESPEDYGDYFEWGETETKDGSSTVTYGVEMDDIAGNAEYDAATANWGGSWRMPTYAEMNELVDDCTWEWTTQNDVNGYLVTGSTGNSIFLPAAGELQGKQVEEDVWYGNYWTSTPYEDDATAYYLEFGYSFHGVGNVDRFLDYSVRPVSE